MPLHKIEWISHSFISSLSIVTTGLDFIRIRFSFCLYIFILKKLEHFHINKCIQQFVFMCVWVFIVWYTKDWKSQIQTEWVRAKAKKKWMKNQVVNNCGWIEIFLCSLFSHFIVWFLLYFLFSHWKASKTTHYDLIAILQNAFIMDLTFVQKYLLQNCFFSTIFPFLCSLRRIHKMKNM